MMFKVVRKGALNPLAKAWWNSTPRAFATKAFKLADIGEGIAEVEVLQWYVKPGDAVKEFDKICEVQSDKATVEITSRYTGKIADLRFNTGDIVPVGSTLVNIEIEGSKGDENEESQDVKVDDSNQNKIFESADSTITKNEAEANHSEKPREEEGSNFWHRVGSFSIDPVIRPENENTNLDFRSENLGVEFDGRPLATPAVRRLARDHNLNLSHIPSSGKNGRVVKEDVLLFLANATPEQRQRASISRDMNGEISGSSNTSELSHEKHELKEPIRAELAEDKVVPISGIQRIMVKTMEASLSVPHFNFMEEYDMDAMVDFKNILKPTADSHNLKLTYMPLILKAASLALLQFPQINAHFLSDEMKLVQKSSHNIGVAMDTPRGLLVPVIKDCQRKSIMEIAHDLAELQKKGSDNQLGEKELSGCTFTLSNIGALGGTYASPIIPVPTVAIGAIGRIRAVPRFRRDQSSTSEGSIYEAKVLNMSWAADHRVVDGATIARYSTLLKSYLETPSLMLAVLS